MIGRSQTPRLLDLRVLDRYAGVKRALRSRHLAPAQHVIESEPIIGGTLITLSGDEHTRRRRIHAGLFAETALEEYERSTLVPVIERTMRMLPETAPAESSLSIDLVPFTSTTLAELAGRLIGLEDVDSRDGIIRLSVLYGHLAEGASVEWSTRDHGEVVQEALWAKSEFWKNFVAPGVAARRERGGSQGSRDLLGALLADEGHAWSDEELLRECILYLVAAIGTTSALVTHAVDELAGWFDLHPEDRKLSDSPEFLRKAAIEALRLHVPTTALIRRPLKTYIDDQGRKFEPHELLALDLGGANRDLGEVGGDAESFNPYREVPTGVASYGHAFGGGPHMCLGRMLAVRSTPCGTDGSWGIAVRILHALFSADIRPDQESPPKWSDTYLDIYSEYPVILNSAKMEGYVSS
jgi:cytochrome P450